MVTSILNYHANNFHGRLSRVAWNQRITLRRIGVGTDGGIADKCTDVG